MGSYPLEVYPVIFKTDILPGKKLNFRTAVSSFPEAFSQAMQDSGA